MSHLLRKVPACQINVGAPEVRDVGLGPRVLVAPDHHAGVVAPQEQQPLVLKVVVSIEPVLQGKVGEDVGRLRYEHLPDWLHDTRFRHVAARLG